MVARGLCWMALLALGGKAIHGLCPALPLASTTLVLGVAAGSAWPRLVRNPPFELPLFVGMILLGAQFRPELLHRLDAAGLVSMFLHWAVVGSIFGWLVRRRQLPPRTGGIVAVGVTGCGISALTAAHHADDRAPLRARDLGIAVVLVSGAVGFLLFPAAARAVGLSRDELAVWAGVAMPTTAEAVLIGAGHSPEALQLVAAYRFLVNLAQGIPVLVYVHLHRRGAGREGVGSLLRHMPAFTWGLAILAALGLIGSFAGREREALAALTNWAFLLAVAGVGLRTRISLFREVGARDLLVCVAAWGLASAVLLFVVRAIA